MSWLQGQFAQAEIARCGNRERPTITRKAVDKIDRLVADAVRQGANVVCGGQIPNERGFFYQPEVPRDAGVASEEIFCPGLRVAGKVEAGMIGLNRGLDFDPAAPFGGVKHSGLGREGGRHHGIAEFMEAKYIATSF